MLILWCFSESDKVSESEKRREKNIERNKEILSMLQLHNGNNEEDRPEETKSSLFIPTLLHQFATHDTHV